MTSVPPSPARTTLASVWRSVPLCRRHRRDGARLVVFGRNPVRDWILVERAFSRTKRRAVRHAIYYNITYLKARLATVGGIFYQYCVPNGTYLDRLATPVFYDKNRIVDYQQLTRSSEHDGARPVSTIFHRYRPPFGVASRWQTH